MWAMPKAPAPAKPQKGDHVFLVDGSSYIFRAYWQSMNQDPKYNRRSDGLPTGAVRMFFIMLWRILAESAGGAADASRSDLRQIGKDLPH